MRYLFVFYIIKKRKNKPKFESSSGIFYIDLVEVNLFTHLDHGTSKRFNLKLYIKIGILPYTFLQAKSYKINWS